MHEATASVELDRDAGDVRARMLMAAALILICLLAYAPAFDAGFVFDDSLYVTEDARMASADGLGRIWTEVGGPQYRHQYYPLTGTVFWMQHRLWGDRPFGYHFVNILLHAANAVLLWVLLRRLRVPGAWLAGAIFAVHPVHAQSVAWVSELKNVLSACFFLLSALVFVRWFELEDRGIKASRHQGIKGKKVQETDATMPRFCLGLMLFICALLSKTATCVLPVALFLVIWWKRGSVRRRDVAALAPLVGIGLSMVLLTAWLESSHGGATGETFDLSWAHRLLIAGRAVCFYADKLARPVGLMFIYPRWDVHAGAWPAILFPLAVVAAATALWLARRRIGRAPPACLAFFIAAVAPISMVNVAFFRFSFVADHWQYLASMGPIALAAAGAALLAARLPRPAWSAGAAAAVLAALTALTWQRASAYESRETLWRDTLAANPQAWVAHHNLGAALAADGRTAEAMASFRRALDLHPEYAGAHNSLAVALQKQGRRREAVEHYREALRINPSFAEAHYNLANALQAAGDTEGAVAHYRDAIRLGPPRTRVYSNLGVALYSAGRLEEAIACFESALRIDPTDPIVQVNLDLARRQKTKGIEAF